jgi:hypothetical protein
VTDIVGQGIVRDRRARLKLPSSQDVVSVLVLVFCGVLVLYPMVYLVILSVNVGDPQTFPPDEFGIEHYGDLFESWRVIANTAFVASIATVMAILIGFLAAWALTRTQLPGVAWLELLMQLPYHMTPLELLIDLAHRVAQGFVGDSHEAAVGVAQLQDKEDRARDRERAHQQRHRHGCIEAREETETEKQHGDPEDQHRQERPRD